MFGRVDRILLRVPSLGSAVAYYRDVLGLKLLRQDKQVAAFMLGDGVTELLLLPEGEEGAGTEVYFSVDDVRDLYARRGELKLKFLQPPRQAARGYRATMKDAFGQVWLLLDRTTESAGAGAIEDGSSGGALFAGVEPEVVAKKELLGKLYEETGRTADDLPYTPQFEKLYGMYVNEHREPKPTRGQVWKHLLNLRKSGKLPRLGEARGETPEVSEQARGILRGLLGKDIGKRDRLPYTERFEKLVDEFNRTQERAISPHLVWRLVAKLAK